MASIALGETAVALLGRAASAQGSEPNRDGWADIRGVDLNRIGRYNAATLLSKPGFS